MGGAKNFAKMSWAGLMSFAKMSFRGDVWLPLVPIEEVIAYLELTSMLRARLKGHAMTSEGDAFQQAKQFFEESKMMIMPALVSAHFVKQW